MRIYIDTQGTLSANVAGHSLQDCLQAAHDLSTVASVSIMSGDPERARELLGLGPLAVLDKCDVFRGDLRGAMVVDDEPAILAAAVRAGACAVPAAMLLEVADAMVPARRCDELFAPRKPCGHEYCPACEAEVSCYREPPSRDAQIDAAMRLLDGEGAEK